MSSESRLSIAERFLDILKRHNISEAYAFINSKKVEEQPETRSILSAWLKAGYPLGNHSFSHMDLNKNPAKKFLNDVKIGEDLIAEMSPQRKKWFRYPYLHEGNTLKKRNAVRKGLAKMGYQIAQVTVDFEDWAWNAPYVRCSGKKDQKSLRWLEKSYLEHALNRLASAQHSSEKLFGRQIKHILLLHVGLFDSLMLDKLLSAYERQGVQFISLSEAASDPAYQEDPHVTFGHGGGFLEQLHVARKVPYPTVEKLPLRLLDELCR
jgi:peptidoglycan/xylan/chitin deacetylase (PgdA/CDA1 family)